MLKAATAASATASSSDGTKGSSNPLQLFGFADEYLAQSGQAGGRPNAVSPTSGRAGSGPTHDAYITDPHTKVLKALQAHATAHAAYLARAAAAVNPDSDAQALGVAALALPGSSSGDQAEIVLTGGSADNVAPMSGSQVVQNRLNNLSRLLDEEQARLNQRYRDVTARMAAASTAGGGTAAAQQDLLQAVQEELETEVAELTARRARLDVDLSRVRSFESEVELRKECMALLTDEVAALQDEIEALAHDNEAVQLRRVAAMAPEVLKLCDAQARTHEQLSQTVRDTHPMLLGGWKQALLEDKPETDTTGTGNEEQMRQHPVGVYGLLCGDDEAMETLLPASEKLSSQVHQLAGVWTRGRLGEDAAGVPDRIGGDGSSAALTTVVAGLEMACDRVMADVRRAGLLELEQGLQKKTLAVYGRLRAEDTGQWLWLGKLVERGGGWGRANVAFIRIYVCVYQNLYHTDRKCSDIVHSLCNVPACAYRSHPYLGNCSLVDCETQPCRRCSSSRVP